MEKINSTVPSTDIHTRMTNMLTKSHKDDYCENKKTMTNIHTNEQIEAVLGRKWFSVLEADVECIKIGDEFVYNYYHYMITGINDEPNFGFTAVHFTRSGPMMPQRRRRDLEAVPV